MSHIATFSEFYNYFEAIARSHADITSYRFGDKDVVKCASRSNLPDRTLWVEAYEPVSVFDSRSDNHSGTVKSAMVILAPMPKKWEDQRTTYEELEAIIKDILGKILYDFNEGALQVDFNRYSYGWAEMALGATEMLGCRLDFSFIRPERLVYNPAKWT